MPTVTLDIGGMISPHGIMAMEKQLRSLPGVLRAEVEHAMSSATVEYDDDIVDLDSIKTWIRKCGYHCDTRTPTLLCPAPAKHEDK
jgi:P-type Cu2+ transporter